MKRIVASFLVLCLSLQAFGAQIETKFIQDSAISTIKIADSAVTTIKIASISVNSQKMNSEGAPSGWVPTATGSGNGVSWQAQSGGGGSGINARWVFEGPVIPFTNVDGPHYVVTATTLSQVYLSIKNSGSSGSTTLQVNQYRSGVLQATATVSISASSSQPASSHASLSGSLSLQVGDILTWDINSIAKGAPESLAAEY